MLAFGVAACDDPAGSQFDPQIATDTVTLAPPGAAGAALPSAVDLAVVNGLIGGGRYPERQTDADLGFDLLLRERDGALVFLPAGATGILDNSGRRIRFPGITPPRTQTFEEISEAPSGIAAYVEDEAVPVAANGVYIARTRAPNPRCAAGQYAKLHVLEIGAGNTLQLEIAANENCNDTRLVAEED